MAKLWSILSQRSTTSLTQWALGSLDMKTNISQFRGSRTSEVQIQACVTRAKNARFLDQSLHHFVEVRWNPWWEAAGTGNISMKQCEKH